MYIARPLSKSTTNINNKPDSSRHRRVSAGTSAADTSANQHSKLRFYFLEGLARAVYCACALVGSS